LAFGGPQAGRATSSVGGGRDVKGLLQISRLIDAINDRFATLAIWLVLLACLVSAANATARYLFNAGSNAWFEAQWYMFAAMVLLGAPHVLKVNEHVRVDVFYGNLSERTRIWIDIIGGFLFLLPMCAILIYFAWPWFARSWTIGETSHNAGGLLLWPIKLLFPLGFALMALQGISEIIKRFAALQDLYRLPFGYEKPPQ
jgi:TRAP-type mannitol/chloroaromatic compound transport system permease small subunit